MNDSDCENCIKAFRESRFMGFKKIEINNDVLKCRNDDTIAEKFCEILNKLDQNDPGWMQSDVLDAVNNNPLLKAIHTSAEHAYSDLQLRTLHKSEEETEEEDNTNKPGTTNNTKQKDRCVLVTTALFYKYFIKAPKKDCNKWDGWHKESCNYFCKAFIGGKENQEAENQKYGKAQKMINMTFKYLYCFDALRENGNKDYFKWCHMPLDSYMLRYWFAEIDKEASNSESKKIPWSKLKYDSQETNELTYMDIQSEIRMHFKNNENYGGLTPFQAEFCIWEEEKAKETLKYISKAAKVISGENDCVLQEILRQHVFVEDDCKNLKDCINKISKIKKAISVT